MGKGTYRLTQFDVAKYIDPCTLHSTGLQQWICKVLASYPIRHRVGACTNMPSKVRERFAYGAMNASPSLISSSSFAGLPVPDLTLRPPPVCSHLLGTSDPTPRSYKYMC